MEEGNAGTKALVFTLKLDEVPSEAITVNYETLTTGSAAPNGDFLPTAGTVVFAAGQTTASVQVAVSGDTTFEANETVQVKFSGARLVADAVATGTITNDDADPGTVPQTLALTTNRDVLVGAGGDDVFNAAPAGPFGQVATTLQSFDSIDGAGGNDTLNIFAKVTEVLNTTGPQLSSPLGFNVDQVGTIRNVETINIYNTEAQSSPFGGEAINASGFQGATLINQIEGYTDVEKLAAGTTAKFTSVVLGDAAAGEDDDVVLTVSAASAAASAAVQLSDVDGQFDELAVGDVEGLPIPAFMSSLNGTPTVRRTVSTENIVVQGDSLAAVSFTGSVNGLAVGDKISDGDADRLGVEAGTVASAAEGAVRAIINAGATVTEVSVNASLATGFVVNGAKLTSVDASASTASIGFDIEQSTVSSSGLASFKSGSGNDFVAVAVASAKDDAATAANETRVAIVNTGAGDDVSTITVTGNGVTNVDLGAGNDISVITAIVGDKLQGQVNINLGAGNDAIFVTGSAATLFSKTVKLVVDGVDATAEVASDLKIAGGDGVDALLVDLGAEGALSANLAGFISQNVSEVENLVLGRVNKASAAQLAEFSTLTFTNGATVSDAVGTQKIVSTAGADLGVTAKGFVLDASSTSKGNQPTIAGSVNIEVADGDAALKINAKDVALTARASLVSNEALLKTDYEGVADAANIYLRGSLQGAEMESADALKAAFGYIENLSVTLEAVRGAGSAAGSEAVSTFLLDGYISGLKTAKFSGAGDVTFDANKALGVTLTGAGNASASSDTSGLTSIDVSGMTEFLNLNSSGKLDGAYQNLSAVTLTLNNAVAETVKLGGARDVITTASTKSKMDVIEGFTLVKDVANSTLATVVADHARSDDLTITGGTDFVAMKGAFATLDDALSAAATLKVGGTDENSVVFAFNGDAYAYVDVGTAGVVDSTDNLVKLVGVTDLDLLASVLNANAA